MSPTARADFPSWPTVRWIYHYLSVLHPSWAEGFARFLRIERQVIVTRQGRFFVDPLSDLGRQLLEDGDYEPEMALILENYLSSGAVFLDLGANEGYFTVVASRLCGASGQVYAVEPQGRCVKVIQENCRLNGCANVTILPVAVSDQAGQITLYLHSSINTGAPPGIERPVPPGAPARWTA
jgi:hypothetical protein